MLKASVANLLTLIDASFEGKNAVKRQQSVYAGLGDLISSGAVHAVTIVARTPAEAGLKTDSAMDKLLVQGDAHA